jgi:hypothetical protein
MKRFCFNVYLSIVPEILNAINDVHTEVAFLFLYRTKIGLNNLSTNVELLCLRNIASHFGRSQKNCDIRFFAESQCAFPFLSLHLHFSLFLIFKWKRSCWLFRAVRVFVVEKLFDNSSSSFQNIFFQKAISIENIFFERMLNYFSDKNQFNFYFILFYFQAYTQVIRDMWNYLREEKGVRHPEEYLSLPTR